MLSLPRLPFLAASLVALTFSQLRADYEITASSFLGGPGDNDRVSGIRLASDGTLYVAANIGSIRPGGIAPTLLDGATTNEAGALLQLSADGRTVLKVARLGPQINDIDLDASNSVYVAAHGKGFYKIASDLSAAIWHKSVPGGSFAWRIDAAESGGAITLEQNNGDVNSQNPGSGFIHVYNAAGTETAAFSGYRNTLDVCLDDASQTAIYVGWRQATADGNPVQISFLRGKALDGADKWLNYDWSTDNASPNFINRPENNMADTRGLRCSIGRDGKLYAAFECAGGNHIFRYSPTSVTNKVSIVRGDFWHDWYNTASEHKTFFARYEPATGAYLRGQQFCGRLSNDKGNTVRPREIGADETGRVWIGGASAYGLPLPGHPKFNLEAEETAFLPANTGTYLGGSWVLLMSADFTKRLYCTRLSSGGETRGLDIRTLNGKTALAFGGNTPKSTETFTTAPIQPAWGGGTEDGWLAVIPASDLAPPASTSGGTSAGASGGGSSTSGAGGGSSSGNTTAAGSGAGGGSSGGGAAFLPWMVEVRRPRTNAVVRFNNGIFSRGLIRNSDLPARSRLIVMESGLVIGTTGALQWATPTRAKIGPVTKKGVVRFRLGGIGAGQTPAAGQAATLYLRAGTNLAQKTTEPKAVPVKIR